MFLLEAENIEKQYGNRTILSFEELRVYSGDKIGIVGDNGAGKSTLLGILAGSIKADKGQVTRHGEIHFLRQFEENDDSLSGGENQKKHILDLEKGSHKLIFADEPTANLDEQGKRWLTGQLADAETVLLISHDRQLLDDICNQIVEIKDGKLNFYTGNYSDYVDQLELENQAQEQEYGEYQRNKRQLEQAVRQREDKYGKSQSRYNTFKLKNNSEARLGKFRMSISNKKKEKEITGLKNRLGRLQEVSRPDKEKKLRLDFSKTQPPQNKRIIYSDSFSFSYGDDKIFSRARFEVFREEKLAIVGENGCGKTTLLREIYKGNADITTVPKLKIGFLRQNFSQLEMNKTVLENALVSNVQTRDIVFSVLAGLLFTGNDLDKKAEVLSGGERTRLGLAMLILSDINTLFLDEPTNFLDIKSLKALETTLTEYPGAVVFVSHDSQFVDKVAQRKLVIQNKSIVAPQINSSKVKVDILALELKRTRLVEEMSSASAEDKKKLEREYQQVIAEINSTR